MQTDCAHNSARTVFNREKIFSRQNAYILGARGAGVAPLPPLRRGGWSLRLANGQAVGNYASRADALSVARWNGYTDAKKDASK